MSASYAFFDAFTTTPQAGNPAAVAEFHSRTWPSDTVIQDMAREFDMPMTACLLPCSPSTHADDKTGSYELRWFNPVSEQWICGHATVAASAYIFMEQPGRPSSQRITRLELKTVKYGTVYSSLENDPFNSKGDDGTVLQYIAIDFPESINFKDIGPHSLRYQSITNLLTGISGRNWAPDTDEGKTETHVNVLNMVENDRFLLIEIDPSVDLESISIDADKLVSIPTRIRLCCTIHAVLVKHIEIN